MDSDESRHLFSQKPQGEEGKWESLERPTIRSRGLAALDPFNSRDEIQHLEEELRAQGFELSESQVPFRRVSAQGSVVGVEVKVKVGPKGIRAKTGSDYLGEGLRTVAIEMRDMLIDLNRLNKLLAKQEFEETSYFA